MARRGAIFDLDGTLADTAADLLAAANVALAPRGLPALKLERDKSYAGRGARSMIRRSLELDGRNADSRESVELTDQIYPDLLDAYRHALAVETRLFDGVETCLDVLATDNWALGVCTNKPEAMALGVLRSLGVLDRFGAVLGADTLPVRKPDPEHLLETARRAGADPKRIVLVGDTLTDLRTARAAGAPCIITRFGFAAETPESLEPDALAAHYSEIPGLLEQLCPERAAT